MNELREHLTAQLRAKLDRYGVVTWVDAVGEYRDAVDEVAPDNAAVVRLDGSWYELRRRAEPHFETIRPRLVIYVDRETPADDPLAEMRLAGTEFRIRLETLLRQALAAEVAGPRLSEIGRTAATLADAEAILAASGGGPAPLVAALGVSEPSEILLRLAAEGTLILQRRPELAGEALTFTESQLGAAPAGAADLQPALARHLVLVELAAAVPVPPEAIAAAWPRVTRDQEQRSLALLRRWRHDATLVESFTAAMRDADRELALADVLPWHDALAELDAVPAYDRLAFVRHGELLADGDFAAAEHLAGRRSGSVWIISDRTGEARHRWAVAHALSRLRRLLSEHDARERCDLATLLRRYAEHDWEIDRAHRRLEVALLGLADRTALEESVRDGRRAYEAWLDDYLRIATSAAAEEGLATGDLLPQGHVHADAVEPRARRGPVVYVLVDALRFELGKDLVDALHRQFEDADISIQPAVGLVPSLTPLGMANLCPGAESDLELALQDDHLEVRIDGEPVMTPAQRVRRLQAAHGEVADLRLDDIFRLGDRELGERVGGAPLVLVRSQEIDEAGETGKLNVGLNAFDATVREISRALARLVNHDLRQFVVTSDHGFVALTREVSAHMIVPKPGGRGTVHRRAFVGRGGTAGDALLRLPADRLGLPGDLNVLVPRGLALIAAGGARGFFHGGLSPQELVVPVVSVTVPERGGTAVLALEVELAPKITGHVFTGSISLPPSLLSETVVVRPVATRLSDGRAIALLVTAGGSEQGEGLVRLDPSDEVTLGFRVTASMRKGDKVQLEVLDARTDRRLGVSRGKATVARVLEAEDDLP